jgi:hypothetical protein
VTRSGFNIICLEIKTFGTKKSIIRKLFEFCKRYEIKYEKDDMYFGGYWFNTRLRVKTFEKPIIGIIAGKRLVDIDGTFDYDEGWSFGRQLPVYLVAISLKQICRVPEEYLEKIGG